MKDKNLSFKSWVQNFLDLMFITLDKYLCKWLIDNFDLNLQALDLCGKMLPISIGDEEYILRTKSKGVDVYTIASPKEINHISQNMG